MDDTITILFQDYLDEQLSGEDRLHFEKRLKEDSEFAANFEAYRKTSKLLTHQFSEERAQLEASLQQVGDRYFSDNGTKKKETKVIRFAPWKYGIAASMVVLVGFFIFQNLKPFSAEAYRYSDSISLTERSSEGAISKQAETAFNTKAYSEAIMYFDTLLEQEPDNTELQFYQALSYDALSMYGNADMLFDNLIAGHSAFRHKAIYYKAISLWSRQDIEAAKMLLETLPEIAPEYKDARTILKKL